MNEGKAFIQSLIVDRLVTSMTTCQRNGISFNACLATARRRFNKAMREAALKEQP